jgi:hypothetical protein
LLPVPKLLPTVPVQLQLFPTLSVHLAVAVVPTVMHVTLASTVNARKGASSKQESCIFDQKLKDYESYEVNNYIYKSEENYLATKFSFLTTCGPWGSD